MFVLLKQHGPKLIQIRGQHVVMNSRSNLIRTIFIVAQVIVLAYCPQPIYTLVTSSVLSPNFNNVLKIEENSEEPKEANLVLSIMDSSLWYGQMRYDIQHQSQYRSLTSEFLVAYYLRQPILCESSTAYYHLTKCARCCTMTPSNRGRPENWQPKVLTFEQTCEISILSNTCLTLEVNKPDIQLLRAF